MKFLLFLNLASGGGKGGVAVLPFQHVLNSVGRPFRFQELREAVIFTRPFGFSEVRRAVTVLTYLVFGRSQREVHMNIGLVSTRVLQGLLVLPHTRSRSVNGAVFLTVCRPVVERSTALTDFP